jgi:glycosyltransferase involved in cell wall biosynthesis
MRRAAPVAPPAVFLEGSATVGKLVSVVIPAYNYARFVGRAVDSVLAQTYAPVECVVVDDGSTDETPQVLARYGGRIRSIRQENRGLSGTRNTGIRAARGEYVALLDADDYWRPDKIARQVELAEATPGVGAVGCFGEAVDRDGSHLRYLRFPAAVPGGGGAADGRPLATQLRAIALREHWVGCSSSGALIPRAVLDEVGPFDETLRAAEDWDMWLRIAARHAIVNVTDVLAFICQHGTGSFRNAEKMETNQWKVYERAIERWPRELPPAVRRKMRANILADAGGEYIFGREYKLALRRYAASLKEWPMERLRWYAVARLLLRQVGV